jgi:hypothetical protein
VLRSKAQYLNWEKCGFKVLLFIRDLSNCWHRDLTVALLRNNLAYGLKKCGKFDDALEQYQESYFIRT